MSKKSIYPVSFILLLGLILTSGANAAFMLQALPVFAG